MESQQPKEEKINLAADSLVNFLACFTPINKLNALQQSTILSETLALLDECPDDTDLLNLIILVAKQAKAYADSLTDPSALLNYDVFVEFVLDALPSDCKGIFETTCARE